MKNGVFVVGVGLTKFEKPGSRENFDYPQMVEESVKNCLKDAKLSYKCIDQACVGYVYGDSSCGQKCLYRIGFTGLPIYNVHNNCATGSTALFIGYQLIKGGAADCILVVGFEKMEKGSLGSKYDDRENPLEQHVNVFTETRELEAAPIVPQMFGAAGREHMEKYGTKAEHFAKIAEKNHRHSCNNPHSQFQKEHSLEEILASRSVYNPLTKLQCCPTSDGSAAVIIASEKFVRDHQLGSNAVEILGMEMSTDSASTFNEKSCIKMVGYDMTKNAAEKLFQNSGLKPTDVDVIELHDCFSVNELITYEALGLCAPGEGSKLVDSGNNTYGGKYVINPSGGLLSKGHPLGATGVAQCVELCWQLRGFADKRQVPGAKLGLQHNIGLGGAAVVALYSPYIAKSNIEPVKSSIRQPAKDFKVAPIFRIIADQLKQDGGRYVSRMKGIFCFKVNDGPDNQKDTWIVDAKNGTGSVHRGESEIKGDVTLIVSDNNLFDIMIGKLNPQKAFMNKKLKIKGNVSLALKLRELKPADLRAKL